MYLIFRLGIFYYMVINQVTISSIGLEQLQLPQQVKQLIELAVYGIHSSARIAR